MILYFADRKMNILGQALRFWNLIWNMIRSGERRRRHGRKLEIIFSEKMEMTENFIRSYPEKKIR